MPRNGVCLFVSHPNLTEIREKLVGRFGLPAGDVERFIARLKGITTLVSPTNTLTVVADDPDDNRIIECAVAAQAQLIVSADHHLLRLNPYRGIGIAHPKELKGIFATDFEQAA